MKAVTLCLALALGMVPAAAAQHEHPPAAPADTVHAGHAMGQHEEAPEAHAGHAMEQHEEAREPEAMGMSSTLLPNLPMSRDGSGTSWQPDASPMHAVHGRAGGWGLMFHGSAWLRYNAQDAFGSGTKGDRQLDAPNWFMLMAQRQLTRSSQLGLRAMLSLDPVIMGGRGYPLLFQTGETYQGEPLIDRQHPHDLFSELAVVYGRELGRRAGFFAYFGLAGEPALGPPAFMHRPSAVHLPDAPLGHHWQDATHIVFGTATLGFRYGIFKLDGSVFTGSEPDEERFGIDRPRFDSYSLRLAANPTERWALQVSRGFLKEPEVLHPGEDQWRTSASALYVTPLSPRASLSTAFVWGMNQAVHAHGQGEAEEEGGTLQSLLVESDLQLRRQAFYGRAEWVQKPAGELGLEQFDHARTFGIGALSLGTSREILALGDLRVDLGGHATLYAVPSDLRPVYGERPVSLQVYLRLGPPRMHAGHHAAPASPAGPAHQGHHGH